MRNSTIDISLLHLDILKKINELEISQAEFSAELDICKRTLRRLQQGNIPKIEIFIKLIDWLDTDANRYINKNPRENDYRR